MTPPAPSLISVVVTQVSVRMVYSPPSGAISTTTRGDTDAANFLFMRLTPRHFMYLSKPDEELRRYRPITGSGPDSVGGRDLLLRLKLIAGKNKIATVHVQLISSA